CCAVSQWERSVALNCTVCGRAARVPIQAAGVKVVYRISIASNITDDRASRARRTDNRLKTTNALHSSVYAVEIRTVELPARDSAVRLPEFQESDTGIKILINRP